jgi:hypothetical protein
MRLAACLLLLLAAPVVQAQMYKCTEGGKTRYSDKPITDCKSATTITSPTPSAPAPGKGPAQPPKKMALPHQKASAKKQDKKGAPPPPKELAKAPPTEHDKKYASARCRELKEEQTWLLSPRGAKVERRDERLGQVQQALAACR